MGLFGSFTQFRLAPVVRSAHSVRGVKNADIWIIGLTIGCHSAWDLLISLSWAESCIEMSQGCVSSSPMRYNGSFLEIIFISRSSLRALGHKCRASGTFHSKHLQSLKTGLHDALSLPQHWREKARPPEPRSTCSFTWHRVAWSADIDRRDSAARLTQNLTWAHFVCSSLWGQIQRHSWHLSRWQKQKSHCLHVIAPLPPLWEQCASAQVRKCV